MGICESVFWLIIVAKIFTYLDEHPEKENLLLLICFIVGWLGIAYITFKPYPMDYVDGKLLVDPQKMMNDGYGDICLLIVFPVARYIEKRWIGFQAPGLKGAGLAAGDQGREQDGKQGGREGRRITAVRRQLPLPAEKTV